MTFLQFFLICGKIYITKRVVDLERKVHLISYIVVTITVILCYSIYIGFDTNTLSENTNSVARISYDEIISEEAKLIDSQVEYYQDYYNVTINLIDDIKLTDSNYDIDLVNNNYTISTALDYLGDYFRVFNKEFFNRFYENDMNGLNIYLASNIDSTTNFGNNAEIVGLFYKQDNKYIIVIDATSEESLAKIAFHETMHAIEEYLRINNVYFRDWNSLNPYSFNYSNTLSTDLYSDVMGNNSNRNEIYFLDNYARSSASEDRARMFEFICLGNDFSRFPRLYEKANYLKDIVFKYFPELSYSKYIG